MDYFKTHHGDNTGNDRLVNARGTGPGDKIEVLAVLEKELRDDEFTPEVELELQVREVGFSIDRLGMRLRITGDADAELGMAFLDELPDGICDQFTRARYRA